MTSTEHRAPAVTTYRGRAGDHSDRAMAFSHLVGDALARRVRGQNVMVGRQAPALSARWEPELDAARADLRELADRYEKVLSSGAVPLTALTRCAAAIATLPVVVRHRPEVAVVWLDAHGDINTPADSSTGFLGGMALSGPMGWWDTGFGAGLATSAVVLVGARDLDDAERAHLDAGTIAHVPVGQDGAERLADLVAGRPVYLHLDCDVLEPGIVSTDYHVAGGMDLEQLHAVAEVAGSGEVIGMEIAEFEGAGSRSAADLVGALEPLLAWCSPPVA